MAHEPTIALRVLQTLLSGTAGVKGVYSRTVPAKAAFPYILIVPNGGTNESAGGGRVLGEPVYLVKVVAFDITHDKLTDSALESIDARLENYQEVDGASGALVTITSVSPLPGFVEPTDPAPADIRHEGAYWRVSVAMPLIAA